MPSIFVLRHQVGNARVHNCNLAFRVSRAVRCLAAAARAPVVANKPFCCVELSLVQYLAFERLGPPHNKMHHARVLRSIAYVVQPRFKLLHRQVCYRYHYRFPLYYCPLQTSICPLVSTRYPQQHYYSLSFEDFVNDSVLSHPDAPHLVESLQFDASNGSWIVCQHC